MGTGTAWVFGLAAGSVLLLGCPLRAADFPAWAYPANPPARTFDADALKRLPGSPKSYTQAQIEDDFAPPDWFPDAHPPMPPVVANGRPPAVKACSKCHGSNGAGHPESSDLAGLPVAYIQHQIADFKSGARKGARAGSMFPIAKAVSDADLLAAAEYYTALPRTNHTTVVETDAAPKTRLETGGVRLPVENGGTEPIGNRIIELPRQAGSAELRDPRVEYVAYVPVGSLARGKALVTTGADSKTLRCAICHGADLRGAGEVPPIVGRSPLYVFRQLNDFQAGTRAGPNSAMMRQVVANLGPDDMLAIAAYLTSRGP